MKTPQHNFKKQPGARRHQRRGFVFVMIMVMIAVAVITLGSSIDRATMQSNLTQMQLDGYQEHHEMQGIKAIVQVFLFRQEAQNLPEISNTGQPVRDIIFEDGRRVRLYVQDGQGTLLRNLVEVDTPEGQRFVSATLSRIPEDHTEFTRLSGPWKVSIRSAPDSVLEAMSGGDLDIFSGLRQARDDAVENVGELLRALDRAGVDPTVAQALSRNITFAPVVWRVDVEVTDAGSTRYYSTMVTRRGNVPRLMEWRNLHSPLEVLGFGQLGGTAGRRNVAVSSAKSRRR